jgi:hypothetical protein
MPDDPDFPSSEDMLAEARKEIAEPLDEKALLEPVRFDDSAPAAAPPEQSLLFETAAMGRHDPDAGMRASGLPRAEVLRAVKVRLVVGLAIGILVMVGVIVAALAASGR